MPVASADRGRPARSRAAVRRRARVAARASRRQPGAAVRAHRCGSRASCSTTAGPRTKHRSILHDAAEDQGGYRRLREIRRATARTSPRSWTLQGQLRGPEAGVAHAQGAVPRAPRGLVAKRTARLDRRQGRQRELDPRDLASHAGCGLRRRLLVLREPGRAFNSLQPGPRADELTRLASELSRRHAAADNRYALAYSEVTVT